MSRAPVSRPSTLVGTTPSQWHVAQDDPEPVVPRLRSGRPCARRRVESLKGRIEVPWSRLSWPVSWR
jgi:hypothetical protein